MAEIRVLDKHTAELIAAGEVVERYAGDFYIAVFMCYVGHLLASHP